MAISFVGFHGTTRECANQILKTQYFEFSRDDEEWLGTGIYFFEDDYKQAMYFCTKARCYPAWAVLKCDIKADIVIDLIKVDVFEEFRKIALKIKGRYLKRSDGKPRKLINAVVLNMMYKAKPYDLVRSFFTIEKSVVVERTNIELSQIQLCVRHRECITSVQEVS